MSPEFKVRGEAVLQGFKDSNLSVTLLSKKKEKLAIKYFVH